MQYKLRRLILAWALMFVGLSYLGSATAQEKLRIAWAGGASSAPIWIVQEKGLMKKQGVNAEIIRVGASTMALHAMLAERARRDRHFGDHPCDLAVGRRRRGYDSCD